MSVYSDNLLERKKELEQAIRSAREYLDNAPEGQVRVSKNGWGKPHYYHVTKETGPRGAYIRKENDALIKALVQKEYSELILKKASKELKHVDAILSLNNDVLADSAHRCLNQNKIPYVTPYMADGELLKKIWKDQAFTTNTYKLEEKVYPTRSGEFVRSKSEAMLADMYYELGIPYRYECELILKNGKRKYPDFTLFDVRNRRIIYHEHMGLFDDSEYRESNLAKIDEYMRNGIYTGKNLFITFESRKNPLNIVGIKRSINEMLKVGR